MQAMDKFVDVTALDSLEICGYNLYTFLPNASIEGDENPIMIVFGANRNICMESMIKTTKVGPMAWRQTTMEFAIIVQC